MDLNAVLDNLNDEDFDDYEHLCSGLYKHISKNKEFDDDEKELLQIMVEKIEDLVGKVPQNIIAGVIGKINSVINVQIQSRESDSEMGLETESAMCRNFTLKRERTDVGIIPESEIKVNVAMSEILNPLILEELVNDISLNKYFKDPRCALLNEKNTKDKTNPYTLDEYGFLIRKKSYGKKNDVFGWKYDQEYRPTHYHYNDILTLSDNIRNIISIQYMINSKLFKPTGNIYKIYIKHYPERLDLV